MIQLPKWLISALIPVVYSATLGETTHSKGYDMPLKWNSFGYSVETSIGTPPQVITSAIDWTWNSHYIATTICLGSPTNTNCYPPGQQLFNQTLSSTFTNLSSQYADEVWNPNHFFFNLDVKVQYASDIQIIGSTKVNVRFQAADMQFSLPAPLPFEGVFGLSPVFNASQSAVSTFWQAWKSGQFSSPLVAFYWCYPGSPGSKKAKCGGHDAIQTLGGINKTLIKGDITWYDNIDFPIINEIDFVYSPGYFDYWTLGLTGLSLGNEPQALNKTTGAGAVLDNASYGRGAALSANAYKNLIALASATPVVLANPPNNGENAFYQFDCVKTAELPPIKYQFAGSKREWEILSKNYVTDSGNGTCVLNVRVVGDGDWVIGNMGETFAIDKYIIMDFETLKIGLADFKW